MSTTTVGLVPAGETPIVSRAAWLRLSSGMQSRVIDAALPDGTVPTLRQMWTLIDDGALQPPYVALVDESGEYRTAELTSTRWVEGHRLPGYLDATSVHAAVARGWSVRLHQPSDWHPALAAFAREIEAVADGAVVTWMDVLAPGEARKSRVEDPTLVIPSTGEESSSLRLTVGPTDASAPVTLRQREGMYLPSGTTYTLTPGLPVVNLVIAISAPSWQDIADAVVRRLGDDPALAELEAVSHRTPLDDLAQSTLDAMTAALESMNHHDIWRDAVRVCRARSRTSSGTGSE